MIVRVTHFNSRKWGTLVVVLLLLPIHGASAAACGQWPWVLKANKLQAVLLGDRTLSIAQSTFGFYSMWGDFNITVSPCPGLAPTVECQRMRRQKAQALATLLAPYITDSQHTLSVTLQGIEYDPKSPPSTPTEAGVLIARALRSNKYFYQVESVPGLNIIYVVCKNAVLQVKYIPQCECGQQMTCMYIRSYHDNVQGMAADWVSEAFNVTGFQTTAWSPLRIATLDCPATGCECV